MRKRIDVVWVEQEGYKWFSVWYTGGRQMVVSNVWKEGVQDVRSVQMSPEVVQFHHIFLISSEYTPVGR